MSTTLINKAVVRLGLIVLLDRRGFPLPEHSTVDLRCF